MNWIEHTLARLQPRQHDLCVGLQTTVASVGARLCCNSPVAGTVAVVDSAGDEIDVIGDQLLPRNVIKAYYSTNLLGLIVFSLLLGQAIAKQPDSAPT